jgi:hypothetical protein
MGNLAAAAHSSRTSAASFRHIDAPDGNFQVPYRLHSHQLHATSSIHLRIDSLSAIAKLLRHPAKHLLRLRNHA